MRLLIPPSLLVVLTAAALATGCQKNNVVPGEDTAALREQLHGKYKLLSATSSEAVDMNGDGLATTNLLLEVANLQQSEVEIRILNPERRLPNSQGHMFVQWWQRPFLAPVAASSPILLSYANQAAPEYFTFDGATSIFTFIPRATPDPNFPAPTSVMLTAADQLTIVSQLPVYTKAAGVHLVEVRTHYQRYTKTT